MLLGSLVGIGHDDFLALESLGLIEPAGAAVRAPEAPAAAAGGVAPQASVAAPLDYAQFTTALTQMISKELGLRGFMLTLAVDKASTVEELQDVARRTLEQIRERKGEAVAAAARHTLYGS